MSRIRTEYIGTVLFLFAAVLLFAAGAAHAREITDMAQRRVTVPDTVKRAYAPSPYGSYIMYSIAPDLLAGLMLPVKEEDKPFLRPSVWSLPVIGSPFAQGRTGNIEVLLKAQPDLVIMWSSSKTAFNAKAEDTLKGLKLPYVYAVAESMNDYPAAYLFLGKVLNREERTEKLATYCRKTLADAKAVVNKVPEAQRPKVYYAEGVDGLSTECNDSIHVEVLTLAGDRNVHRCHTASHMGMEKVTLEQVLIYQPDVIIVQDRGFYDRVFKDPAWQQVKAVKSKRVHLIPRAPFNWFDRPPSFMRFMGLRWLLNCLYPQEYRIDVVREARDFYGLFLGADVSEQQMKKVIYPYVN